jgi:hypothetical protein
MGQDDSDPAPSGGVLLGATAPRAAVPSWGRVLATTVKLSVSWRLRAIGFGKVPTAGPPAGNRSGRRPWHPRRAALRRWPLTVLVLALTLVAGAVLRFTGVLAGTASPAVRVSSPGNSPVGGTGTSGTSSLDPAAAARSQAAAWIASQVSGSAIIACYPDMCAALQAQGVMAGRLMPLRTAAASPLGAGVMVTSPSVRSQLADEYAPALIASFGSGETRIDVRATESGGAAAYQAALRADLAARRSAGSQLLRNSRIQFTAPDAAQLRAGEVDSRLLATLAALASQHSFRVTAFSDTSRGAQVLFREVTITSTGSGGTGPLVAASALVRAQAPPYLPAHVTTVHLAIGQTALSIEFAAPSPLGLLTAIIR